MENILENMSKEDLIATIRQKDIDVRKRDEKISNLQFQISQLQRLLYGSKRERFISEKDDKQLKLPFDVEEQPVQPEEKEEVSYTRNKSRKNHPGRFPLPDHLPVNEILIEPKENTDGLKLIGKEVTDELDYTPGKLHINRFIRPKYAKQDNEGVVVAQLPSRPIEKGIAGAGLLANIEVEKYVYHMPINRQLKKYKQEGVNIPANTVNGWQNGIATLVSPLFDKLKSLVLGQGYIQADETPIKVLDKTKKGTTHRGYYWVYNSPIQNAVIFDYRTGRGREGPKEMLANFKGYLQTDGYVAYDYFARKKDITLLNCMAHARRYFEKALDYDRNAAKHVMAEIQLVYKVERFARKMKLSYDERKTVRLDHALPILNRLGKWMADNYTNYRTKSPMKDALDYTIPRWDNLIGYLNDGALEIDNNLVENSIRPNALGRKNYLFAGSHDAAQRAAMWYSFFGTCARNNVDPYKWLKKVLEIIPEYPVNKIEDLLPQNLKIE